jgi:hypothetical protein
MPDAHLASPSLSAGRGRPPEAAARRAGLEFVKKLLTTNLTSTDRTKRDAGMLLLHHPRPAPSIDWSTWLSPTCQLSALQRSTTSSSASSPATCSRWAADVVELLRRGVRVLEGKDQPAYLRCHRRRIECPAAPWTPPSIYPRAGLSCTAQPLPSGSLKKTNEFQSPPRPSTRAAPS